MSPGGPLPPHFSTGDSVRDKCIEMLAAALCTDSESTMAASVRRSYGNHLKLSFCALVSTDDYKEFGTNCDSMAAEIEDHILSSCYDVAENQKARLGNKRKLNRLNTRVTP